MSNSITVQEAMEKLTNRNTIFVDVRTKQEGFSNAKEAYLDHHIPGAVFLDIKEDVTGKDTFFKEPSELADTLGKLGIDEKTEVILYDEGNHRSAAKAWVALYYIGHEKMAIIEGGFPAWQQAGGILTDEIPTYDIARYVLNVREYVLQMIDDVKNKHLAPQISLIDSRPFERYSGKVEPKYKKAGHIPGAVNYQAKQVFTEHGAWKSKAELKKHFESLNEKEEIIVSCGAGNSACLNVVALIEAGFENVSLYPGGFSEWIEDEANEVATVEEEC